MKTLSNAELQDAIEHTVRLIRGDGSRSSVILTVHLEALTDEQRRRATDELTLEPMTTTLERAEFDARVAAQDGPEWVEFEGLGEIVVELGPRDRLECRYKDGQINKTNGVATVTILPWYSVKEKDEAVAYRIFRGEA